MKSCGAKNGLVFSLSIEQKFFGCIVEGTF